MVAFLIQVTQKLKLHFAQTVQRKKYHKRFMRSHMVSSRFIHGSMRYLTQSHAVSHTVPFQTGPYDFKRAHAVFYTLYENLLKSRWPPVYHFKVEEAL